MSGTSIFLIGPMGSGKSAVGRRLARELGREFIDSDDAIEQRSGVDIPFIFEREGEDGFRLRESKAIDELTCLPGIVLATGGGSAQSAENRAWLHSRGLVVYLHTSVEQQLKRTRGGRERPMLKTGDPPQDPGGVDGPARAPIPRDCAPGHRDGWAQGAVGGPGDST